MKKIIIIVLSFGFFSQCVDKPITADDILNKSIAYHDPNSSWQSLKIEFQFDEVQPGDSIRKTKVWINNQTGFFKINRGEAEIHGVKMDSCFIEKGEVNCDRAKRLRNYYLYLWGLPMKLTDEGTSLNQKVTDTIWQDIPVYMLQVSYEKDDWSYYFKKSNYELTGYSFIQQDGGGEDIILQSEIICSGIRIPKERSWYTLEGKFLGTDILTASYPIE